MSSSSSRLQPGSNPSVALTLFDAGKVDPVFAIACRVGMSEKPEIAWAQYRKGVTFDLSDFEETALTAVAGPDSN